jgi:hypothetical protein
MGKSLISMIAVAICLASLVMGCSHLVVPSEIPRLDTKTEGLAGPFDNITVTLVNAQTDDSNYSVKDWKGRNIHHVLNRKVWTEKLVEALGAELTARHGKVVDRAPVTLSLKVTDVTYPIDNSRAQGWKIYFAATASVTSNSGWTKTYVGKGDTAVAPFSEGSSANRAANWTITDLVRVIMSDPEFTAELARQK